MAAIENDRWTGIRKEPSMDPRIVPLTHILRLNTRLLRNCLEGMTDEVAARRPSAATNNAAFIAAHCGDARFLLLRLLRVEIANPLTAYLAGARGIDQVARLPSLDVIREAWTSASHALRDRLEGLSSDELEADVPNAPPFAGTDKSALAIVTFLVQHESYHVGQLALLRKYVGLPAMSYV
jgi:uncharacterized damage-inducible protein DinB